MQVGGVARGKSSAFSSASLTLCSHNISNCIPLKRKCNYDNCNEDQCAEIVLTFEISQFMFSVCRNLKRLITLALFPWLRKISFKSLFPKRGKWKAYVVRVRETQILPK